MQVEQLLEHSARVDDRKTALIAQDRRLGYGDLDRQSNRMARAFVDAGMNRGDRVVICMENSVEAVAQYLESVLLLPGYILSSQGDRVAMAHSVETRFPFLDHRVTQFAASIPPTLKMKVLNEKYILKRCAERLVPRSIARRTKQPYRAPEGKSFFVAGKARDYVEEALSPQRIRKAGIFDPAAVQSLLEKFRQGVAIGIKDNMAMTGIVSTQLVVDQFIERMGVPT